jgi:hypothetical protein
VGKVWVSVVKVWAKWACEFCSCLFHTFLCSGAEQNIRTLSTRRPSAIPDRISDDFWSEKSHDICYEVSLSRVLTFGKPGYSLIFDSNSIGRSRHSIFWYKDKMLRWWIKATTLSELPTFKITVLPQANPVDRRFSYHCFAVLRGRI